MKQTHEVWVDGQDEEATIHIGTPKQIRQMMNKNEIRFDAKRILEIPDCTFEEAEEQARIYMDENGLEDCGDY